MPKFSIVIPVYNTEKFLKKCLDSVFNQTFKDFEVIVVNDGSTDNSKDIINEYMDRIIYIEKENEGLSSARNDGISASKGEYLLFLDSDDYYENNFLYELSKKINSEEIIRYRICDVFDNMAPIKYFDESFNNLNGIDAFKIICKSHYVEVSCLYCYKRDYWIKNNFSFLKGSFHEDFGLIPLVLIKANSVSSVDIFGYDYYQRMDGISKNKDYFKVVKKANDFLEHFKFLKEESSKIDGDLSIFNSYIANSVILKSTTLKGNDYRKYVKELKKIGAFDMLLSDSFGRKIKKFLIRLSPKLYYKIVRR